MSTTVEIKSERTEYCKICQCYEDENLFDMLQGFKEIEGNEDKLQNICESFTRTTGIELSADDELSRFVCRDCFTRLKEFLLLRQQAVKSHRQIFETQLESNNLGINSEEIKLEKDEIQPQCLICMGYDDDMADIFSDIHFELDVDYEKKLNLIFEDIVGISPADYNRGDKFLCGECVTRLIRIGMFRYQALKVDKNSIEESPVEDMIEIKQEHFNCQICSKAFTDQLEYENHLPCTNQKTSDRPYKCPYGCEKSFVKYSSLQKHQVVHSDERSHVCNICSKPFKRAHGLTEHLRTHSNDRPYVCKVCLKGFKRSAILAKHSLIHNSDSIFSCKICSKTFNQVSYLMRHQKSHSNDRPYACTKCSKSFKNSSTLHAHRRVHQEYRHYQCDVCQKAFKTPRALSEHTVIHNSDRPYACKICQKSFKHAKYLTEHIRHHSNDLRFKCEICSKAFKVRKSLYAHRRTHLADRPYICKICSKDFKDPSCLAQHRRTHREEWKYSCDSCPRTFKYSTGLCKHRRTHKNNSDSVAS